MALRTLTPLLLESVDSLEAFLLVHVETLVKTFLTSIETLAHSALVSNTHEVRDVTDGASDVVFLFSQHRYIVFLWHNLQPGVSLVINTFALPLEVQVDLVRRTQFGVLSFLLVDHTTLETQCEGVPPAEEVRWMGRVQLLPTTLETDLERLHFVCRIHYVVVVHTLPIHVLLLQEVHLHTVFRV